ncbi:MULTISPECIES: recombinase family protein [unclassified Fusibacter]|uniref:recombinase family protein n=1 Tax=unclassified Fusibacter TaxID=2624464 RepID=UPI001013B9C1|nr:MULTISPECIES: recombinase family protein [unclassified Fusibacter]MCK8061336.1 recombinase family protein [Fusibacter sp. A2]NPE23467.1 recombinase family protein [Fusibacter sp. A1]RXV59073.1 recombinase family protein [Fusibacter sp. A1]
MKRRTAIYARVSTEMQAEEGYSIDAQVSNARMNCKSLGNDVVGVYIDRGISGKSMEARPEFMRMMKDAEAGIFAEIVVWKLNRLSRSHMDLLKIYNQLEEYGVSFRSITEPFDTGSPTGKLVFNMLASIGEFERETIVENVKSGMRQKALQGFHNGGKMLGYRSVVDEDTSKSQLTIIEDEAYVIRLIYSMYADGKGGYKAIANYLNRNGFKTIKGNNFSLHAVRDILRNPTYAGKIRFNKFVDCASKKRKGTNKELIVVDGNHEAIIDEVVWNKVKSIIDKNTGRRSKIQKGILLLSGLLKCPECGAPMVAGRSSRTRKDGTKKRYTFYQCNRFKSYGSAECHANSVGADYAEVTVIKRLKDFAFNEEVIAEVVSRINNQISSNVIPLRKRLSHLETEHQQLKGKRDKIFELYEDDMISRDNLKERLDDLDQKLNENLRITTHLKRQIDDNLMTQEVPVERVVEILQNFGKLMDISTREQQKLLLNLAIEKITVTTNREIDQIELRFDKHLQKNIHDNAEVSSDEEPPFFMPFILNVDADLSAEPITNDLIK